MHTKYIIYGNKGKEEKFFIYLSPSFLSKTEIPKYFLYAPSQLLIRKLKRKEEGLLTTVSTVALVSGAGVDDSLGIEGNVCLLLCFLAC